MMVLLWTWQWIGFYLKRSYVAVLCRNRRLFCCEFSTFCFIFPLLGRAWASPTHARPTLVSWTVEFLWYIYMYRTSYVQCTRARTAYGHYAHDLIGNTFARFYNCFVACNEHICAEYFQKSSETITRQGKRATAHTRTRDRAWCVAETAKQRQEKLTKRREIGLGALPRLPMLYKYPIVHCALQTCSIYITTMLS